LALQLELSREVPLTIELTPPLEEWDAIKLELADHYPRIDTISFRTKQGMDSRYHTQKQADEFREFLNNIGPLPNLRCLGILGGSGRGIFNIKEILNRFPSLIEMPEVPLTADDLQLAKDRLNIRTLTTYENPNSILPMVQTIVNLKEVDFLSTSGWPLPDIAEQEKFPAELSNLTSSLGWTTLAYRRYEEAILTSFWPSLSSLVSLHMSIYIKGVYDLANTVHHLHNLQEIRLQLQIYSTDRLLSMDHASPNFSVRSLGFMVYRKSRREVQQTNDEVNDNIFNHMNNILLSLLQVMPKLNNLDLYIDNIFGQTPLPSISFDRSFGGKFNGEKLDLYFYGGKLIPHESSIPSSVHDLVLVLHSDNSFDSFSSKFIKHLYVSSYTYFPEVRTSDRSNILDLELWPSLETLRISTGGIRWSSFSL
ncbi:15694_t:CDS:1, partial [Acaulospora colombiana]